MKRLTVIILAVLVIAFGFLAYVIFWVPPTPEPKLTITDTIYPENGTVDVYVEAGEVFTINLSTNPSTGYDWTIKTDGAIVEYLGNDYLSGGDSPGAQSNEAHNFKALTVGNTNITLLYERSEERGFSQSQVMKNITVKVHSGYSPTNGVIPTKEILITNTNQTVESEAQAVNVVTDHLAEISDANLLRIQGEINKTTVTTINAQTIENDGTPAYLVRIDYSVDTDTEKLTVTVTKDGKIYGTASAV